MQSPVNMTLNRILALGLAGKPSTNIRDKLLTRVTKNQLHAHMWSLQMHGFIAIRSLMSDNHALPSRLIHETEMHQYNHQHDWALLPTGKILYDIADSLGIFKSDPNNISRATLESLCIRFGRSLPPKPISAAYHAIPMHQIGDSGAQNSSHHIAHAETYYLFSNNNIDQYIQAYKNNCERYIQHTSASGKTGWNKPCDITPDIFTNPIDRALHTARYTDGVDVCNSDTQWIARAMETYYRYLLIDIYNMAKDGYITCFASQPSSIINDKLMPSGTQMPNLELFVRKNTFIIPPKE